MYLRKYKKFFEKYIKKENSTFIYIQKAHLNPFSISLTNDFTAKTAIDRSKEIIKKGIDPNNLDPIKIKIDKKGNVQIMDGNARLLTYQHYKKTISSFLIVKKNSDPVGVAMFLNKLK